MMRIRVDESGDQCILIVEGEIEGISAIELEWFWRNLACHNTKTVVMNIANVLHVDRQGRRLLRYMHQQGVRFSGAKLAMRDLLDEIISPINCMDNDR